MTTPDPLPDAWHKMLAKLATVQAERDALRLDLLSIQGCQEAALPGWLWMPREREYVRQLSDGRVLAWVDAGYSPPDTAPSGTLRPGGYVWAGANEGHKAIGFGRSDSPRQAMRDADAAIEKADLPHAR